MFCLYFIFLTVVSPVFRVPFDMGCRSL